jgi:hypothetical protein
LRLGELRQHRDDIHRELNSPRRSGDHAEPEDPPPTQRGVDAGSVRSRRSVPSVEGLLTPTPWNASRERRLEPSELRAMREL